MKIALIMDQLAPGSALKLLSYPFDTIPMLGHEIDALVIKRSEIPTSQIELFQKIPKNNIFYLHDYYPRFLKYFDRKIPGLTFFSFFHIYSYFFAGRAVKRLGKRYDVIIAFCQYTSFSAKSIVRSTGGKYLVLAWDPSAFTLSKIYSEKFGLYTPLLKIISQFYDVFSFCGSSGVINSCHYHGPSFSKLTKRMIYILPPGCNPVPNNMSSERFRDLVSWDRWDYGNDPTKLLYILKGLKDSSIKLTIGGYWYGKDLFAQFKSSMSRLGLDERVELIGELTEYDITSLCLTAKLHVHPIHEAFGMQVLEASAAGCPSVIVKGSGSAELYQHRISGLHPVDTIEDYIIEIDWAFEHPERLKLLSKRAYDVAVRHSWKTHSESIVAICNDVLRN